MLNLKSLLLYVILFATAILAHPGDEYDDKGKGKHCLTDREAYDVLQRWISFFQRGFDPAVAERTLTEDFIAQSGGLNFLTAKDATALTVTSRAQFIEEALVNTANTTNVFTILDWFHDCSNIAFHWSINSSPAVVLGIDYLVLEKRTHRIKKDFSEFNVGAILFNAGFPECQAPAPS
ncbi:hypothetical protein H2201_008933 [Coniosporium apollinis]|uniref:NTF2-like domain-containing protein n=1 Tax=Coniosporium apollinis TaxID=61459 RepID=A0ABQ9NFQ5_9PEZI|nr:hypothetical protein H2201_008933 [Coniosporium apollinis]